MNTDTVWEVLTGVIIVAIMFVLVRPGSNAATTIKVTTDALAQMIQTVVGTAISNNSGTSGNGVQTT